MDSQRKNFIKFSEGDFNAFIQNLKANPTYIYRAHNPADSVTQDRYTFTKNGNRVSVVYETKAQTLIITAPSKIIDEVISFVPQTAEKQEQAKQTADKKQPPEKPTNAAKSNADNKQQPEKSANADKKAQTIEKATKKELNAAKQSADKKQPPEKATDIVKQKADKNRISETKKRNKDNKEQPFTVKKVTVERVNELIKKIKASKNMRYKATSDSGVKTYAVSSGTAKATLRYAGGDLQLTGDKSDLYSELQLMMSQLSDYKTAIKTHIKLTGEEKRASEVQRQLKKKLPAAFEFLSEQSKIDLAIAILDIGNPAVVLSDYSTLLIPCFRGLERLIFDLQHAQGIVVKMIGQAYEKEDGNYVLKSGYRRKIPSVIYAEVMAALYTEYFRQRNFYAHSDGGYDNMSRIITEKQQVQSIFNHILEVINYNGKKLKEIGFSAFL